MAVIRKTGNDPRNDRVEGKEGKCQLALASRERRKKEKKMGLFVLRTILLLLSLTTVQTIHQWG